MSSTPIKVESEFFGEFALFPDESGSGIEISQEEMRKFSLKYSRLYEVYISRLAPKLMEQFNISKPSATLLVRQAFVPLLFCFMDRLVRLNILLKKFPGEFVLSSKVKSYKFNLIEDFQEASSMSPEFNQYLIWFIGRIWNLDEFKLDIKHKLFNSLSPGFKNNLFKIYTKNPVSIIRRLLMLLLTNQKKSKFPALSLSNSKWALHDKGFYINLLTEIKFSLESNNIKNDDALRNKLFTDALISTPELDDFINSLGFGTSEKINTFALFKEFIKLHYPVSLLEAVPQNMKSSKEVLNSFNKSVLISSGANSTSSAYIFAAAKDKDNYIVDFQHGGYYGYIDNWSMISEFEYPGVDQFVSWGWTRIPQPVIGNGLTITDLPSPWLSERKKYWKKLKINLDKEYDFLFFSTKVKRFPDAPQGGLLARDFLHKTAKELKDLVNKITSNQYTILHKPCDITTVKLLSKTMGELVLIGGEKYDVITKLDKGLTYELLNKCNVVLWDQPGTGFLECLSGGIPTMMSWKRTSTSEEEWAKPIFHELEVSGIIHRDTASLVKEMKKFKESPELWMNDPQRVELVSRFCRQFAWTSKDWPKYWRKYFKNISEVKGV